MQGHFLLLFSDGVLTAKRSYKQFSHLDVSNPKYMRDLSRGSSEETGVFGGYILLMITHGDIELKESKI